MGEKRLRPPAPNGTASHHEARGAREVNEEGEARWAGDSGGRARGGGDRDRPAQVGRGGASRDGTGGPGAGKRPSLAHVGKQQLSHGGQVKQAGLPDLHRKAAALEVGPQATKEVAVRVDAKPHR